MKRAFTLIELLVVVTIIAVLAGLLLPALATAKRHAKRVLCQNNLRQYTLADTMYLNEYNEFPPMNDFVPSSLIYERLDLMAKYLGQTIPPAPVSTWPKRAQQPKWINCPMAVDSGIAEGLTVGGGLYTGYAYVGGIEKSTMVSSGFATIVNPGHSADKKNTFRGVLWTDILDEFITPDPRRYEFFHVSKRIKYPDFRFHAGELDGIHRTWSDGSVEWITGNKMNLSGVGSSDLRVQHLLGNYYY